MRRLLLAVALLGAVCGLGGCFTMDAEHNKGHWDVIKTDIREWHSDFDFIMGLDEPTMLETHYR